MLTSASANVYFFRDKSLGSELTLHLQHLPEILMQMQYKGKAVKKKKKEEKRSLGKAKTFEAAGGFGSSVWCWYLADHYSMTQL